MRDVKVDTDSTRKYVTTTSRSIYCRRSEINIWGRYQEGQKRLLVDTYTNLFVPYSDAKVAAALCNYGPVNYALKGRSGLSDNMLLNNSVPNIVKVCGE